MKGQTLIFYADQTIAVPWSATSGERSIERMADLALEHGTSFKQVATVDGRQRTYIGYTEVGAGFWDDDLAIGQTVGAKRAGGVRPGTPTYFKGKPR